MNLFITFEGIEGCGKTTQLRLLARNLAAQGVDVVTTREPGGCPIADAIRQILLDPGNQALVPRSELLLYAAARAQHVDEVIRPALQAGKTVLCDRFTDATCAYQGYGRGLDKTLIHRLNELAAAETCPDLTILLDMPAEEGLQRAQSRNTVQTLEHEGRFEQESLTFHRRVRQGYLELAHRQNRFLVIDALGSQETVASRIGEALRQRQILSMPS
ncbi:MAG: dTMP kinase [Desulfuromonadales bacterium]|nr:dTMP kinase [Desulfuromonadales bacterium]MDW7758257.1 dTMP kinase [Desulfuromonadales bacterium]